MSEVGRRGKRTVACATHSLLRELSTGVESYQEEGDNPAPGSEPSSKEDLRLPFIEVDAPDGLPNMRILMGQSGKAQLEDPNLQNARGQVDGVLLPGVSEWRYPHLAIKHNLLTRL